MPGEQAVQSIAPGADEIVPGEQAVQANEPFTDENEPDGQREHDV